MRSLVNAYQADTEAGEPLPPVFQALEEYGALVRLGESSLIAAAPGVGKSILAVTLAVRVKVPTLMFSMDTPASTTMLRVAAMITHKPQYYIEEDIRVDPTPYEVAVEMATEHIRWDFTSCPTLEYIADAVEAFAILNGDYPHLIVIDNLRNIASDSDDPIAAFKEHIEKLTIMARNTGSAVVVLHHLTGMYEDGDTIPPLSALEGKIGKFSALVLNLFNGKHGDMGIAIVKNRYGPAKPNGKMFCYLPSNTETVQIG